MKKMKNLNTLKNLIKTTLSLVLILTITSCSEDFLDEDPKDFLSPDNTFLDVEGFEAGLVGLYNNGRTAQISFGGLHEKAWEVLFGQGADIGYFINKKNFITDYTTLNSSDGTVSQLWIKFYSIVKDANVIITRAENPDVIWDSEQEKNEVLAQARFFRAYGYRFLLSFWGGVPIIREEITAPKLDFVRDPASDVMEFILQDLEFASQNLPATNTTGAKLTKAAADYLLAETYNTLQQWDKSIAACNRILNDGQYDLMYNRFGSMSGEPGDVYWDLFRYGNQDRRSGNRENIFAWQFEFDVEGGLKNPVERAWGPFLEKLKTPDNMQAILKDERLGRPVVFIRIVPWVETGVWDDFDNDMRNSEYNVQREFYINNPDSAHYGELIQPTEGNYVRNMFPYYRKFTHNDFHPQGYDTSGGIYTDWYVFRVAGVYLLRAEANLGRGDNFNAAADINVLRTRAHASLVDPGNVDIDYILDERVRELLGEEHRRVTLNRVGKLVERTILHNPISGPTIQSHNSLFPIPQSEIDANKEAELVQNPGY